MTLRAEPILDEIRRLLAVPERASHVTWIWGGTTGDSVIVVYRWLNEATLGGYRCDVVELGAMFSPVDTATLAEIIANEIEEPGKVRVDVPDDVRAAVPMELRPGLVWSN